MCWGLLQEATSDARTPLVHAISVGDIRIVRLLVELRADPMLDAEAIQFRQPATGPGFAECQQFVIDHYKARGGVFV